MHRCVARPGRGRPRPEPAARGGSGGGGAHHERPARNRAEWRQNRVKDMTQLSMQSLRRICTLYGVVLPGSEEEGGETLQVPPPAPGCTTITSQQRTAHSVERPSDQAAFFGGGDSQRGKPFSAHTPRRIRSFDRVPNPSHLVIGGRERSETSRRGRTQPAISVLPTIGGRALRLLIRHEAGSIGSEEHDQRGKRLRRERSHA